MLSWRSPGDPMRGGAESLTLEVLRRLVTRGHHVTWFGARYPGSAAVELHNGIRILRSGRQWSVHVHAWRWLRRHLDDFDIVVDQVNTIPFLTPAYVPQRERRMLIFQTAREYWWRQTRGVCRAIAPIGYVAEPLYLRAYRRTRAITISESTRDELVGLGLPRAAIDVIPMATTVRPLDSLDAKDGPLRLIVIGRLTPAKHVEDALRAFANVGAVVHDASLDVVGDGDDAYRRRLGTLLRELGVAERVTFHGHVPEGTKRDLLLRAHVHVFTSHREGWGLTVTEAAALGTPTVGYDAPGVRDSTADARVLNPLTDGPAGLSRRILMLHQDRDLYDAVRAKAWDAARSLSYDRTTDAFLAALHA